ncbi:MAG: ankyrin repeat domain-containing protein, partial [Nitrospinota bacterium]|nr:ankyrin repeat domain-containing protein [Nitrospinota bacterium]
MPIIRFILGQAGALGAIAAAIAFLASSSTALAIYPEQAKKELARLEIVPTLEALEKAVENNDKTLAGLLMDTGVDVNHSGALDMACQKSMLDMAEYLLLRGANPNLSPILAQASQKGDTPMVQLLLRRRADPNKEYALALAAANGHDKVVQALLGGGADA